MEGRTRAGACKLSPIDPGEIQNHPNICHSKSCSVHIPKGLVVPSAQHKCVLKENIATVFLILGLK